MNRILISLSDKLGVNISYKQCFLSYWNLVVAILIVIFTTTGFANNNNDGYTTTNSENETLLVRGPYLQKATSTSMTVRWRTNNKVSSVVRYGQDPNDLSHYVEDLSLKREHVLELSDLKPFTKYYYAIGFGDTILQGTEQNYFLTPPLKDAQGRYTFWVLGDCGDNSTNQKKVRDEFYKFRGESVTNGMILLGDNAYSHGYDDEYSNSFFSIYGSDALKNIPIYPAPGNHDYALNSARQKDHNIAYYNIFDMPTNGEAGGVPSGTESYYSFDYGNIHFVSLDSYGQGEDETRLYDTLGAQVEWVKKDLEANKSMWTIVYWHHAPYTMGHHNSDLEEELALIRSNFLRILERYGVDLVICGHSHCYERSKLIKGHYGKEKTFDPSVHNVSNSTGKYDGSENSCTYLKNAFSSYEGTVYVVSGASGALHGSTPYLAYPHNAMEAYNDITNGGSLILEVEGSRLDALWLNADGKIRDQFTIMKDVGTVNDVYVIYGDSVALTASWKGDYIWSHDRSTERQVSFYPEVDEVVVVTDQYQCIADTFRINVLTPIGLITGNTTMHSKEEINVFPNPFSDELVVSYNGQEPLSVELFNLDGTPVENFLISASTFSGNYIYTLNGKSAKISPGLYMLRIESDKGSKVVRVNYMPN